MHTTVVGDSFHNESNHRVNSKKVVIKSVTGHTPVDYFKDFLCHSSSVKRVISSHNLPRVYMC